METETSKVIDSEILGLSGGLFDSCEWVTTAGPLIDVMGPVVDHDASGPPTRRRVASTNGASWAVIAASAATLAGGVAAASYLSPTETLCPGPCVASAIEALPPGDLVFEAPAAAIEAAPPPGAGAPPGERPAEVPAPPAPRVAPLPAATPWHSPIEALGARATEISRSGAAVAIAWAAKRADRCTPPDDPRATMRVRVTFAPSGTATSAQVSGGSFVGTQVGRCIERALRGAAVRPFDGEPTTVVATIRLHAAPAPRRVAMGP